MVFDVSPSQAQDKIDGLQAEFPDAKVRSIKVDITDDIAVQEAVAETTFLLGTSSSVVDVPGCMKHCDFAM